MNSIQVTGTKTLEKEESSRGNVQKDKGQSFSSNYDRNQITDSKISENIKINNTHNHTAHHRKKNGIFLISNSASQKTMNQHP